MHELEECPQVDTLCVTMWQGQVYCTVYMDRGIDQFIINYFHSQLLRSIYIRWELGNFRFASIDRVDC